MCTVASLLLVLPAAALAAEGGGEHGGGGLISLDKSLIVQVINFVILLVILRRFLYKPFLAKMEERTAAIKRSLDEAQGARAEALRQQEENAAQLRAAYAEAGVDSRPGASRGGRRAGRKRLLEAAQAQARKLRRVLLLLPQGFCTCPLGFVE